MAVYVVGSVNADVTLPVERLPLPGTTILAGDPVRSGGGKGANAAVAAARDGATVRLVGAVGQDAEGAQAAADLRAEGVAVGSMAVLADVPTGVAMICVDADGENLIVVAPGANAALTPAMVADGLGELGADDVCVVNFEIPEDAVRAAAAVAAARGARLLVNPSPVRALAPDLLAPNTTIVANRGELEHLAGTADAAAGADVLKARGCGAVVVTLGSAGVYVTTAAGGTLTVAAYPATPVDTTGAGDTFTGVLAAGLDAGAPLAESVDRGAAAAALSTEGIGARTAMPTSEATDRLMQTRRAG